MFSRSLVFVGALLGMALIWTGSAEAFGCRAACGGCYQRVAVANTYATVRDRVLVRAAYYDVRITPAVYGTRRVRVVATPARTVVRQTAAVYRDEVVRVRTPGRVVVTRQRGCCGDVYCKAYRPGCTVTQTRRVLVKPARTYRETIPAVYAWRDERYLVRPEIKKAVRIPAAYGFVERRVLVRRGGVAVRRVGYRGGCCCR